MTRHIVTIEGDNDGLRRSTNQAIEMLDNLSERAMNLDLSGGLSSLSGTLRGTGGSLALAAGGFVGLAAGAISAANAIGDYVKEYSEVSKATGLTVETLQKLEKQFSGTGLTVEKFGDINKDTLDKLADAWRNGGGIEDDLESVGLKIKDYAEFMNDPQGGMKAAIKVFYDMRKAGASIADVKFMMESLASDSSHMADELQKYGSYQEAVNAINQQTVKITNDTAEEYNKFSKNMDTLTDNLKGMAANALNPVVEGMNNLYNWFDKDWEKTALFNALKTFNERFEKARQNMAMANGGFINKHGYSSTGLAGGQASFNNKPNYPDRWVDSEGVTRDKNGDPVITITGNKSDTGFTPTGQGGGVTGPSKKEQEEAKKKAEEAAKKAKEAAEKAQKAREDAIKRLNALDVKLQGQTAASIASQNKQLEASLKDLDTALDMGLISQQDAAAKRQQLLDQNAENIYKMMLGADPIDALNALTVLQQIRDNELESHKRLLDGKAISYEEYMRRVNDTEQNYSQIDSQLQGMDGFKTNQLTNSLDYQDSNNPFAKFNAIDQEKSEAEQDYKTEKLNIDGINDPAKRMAALEKLNENHQKRMAAIEKKYADARQSIADDMYGGFAAAMTLFGQENTKAMQMAFNAHKAFSIGQATVNMWTAATDAWNDPTNVTTGQKIAAAALAVSQNMGNIANIKSTNVSGMAHDGIDNIPREGTWLLDKGERVVDQRTNGDLKDFLAAQKSGGGNSQPIEVNAPLNINGNVNSSDKMVMDAIKRHAKLVAQAVEDAQRRKM
ncbi:hypothetical protein NKB04_004277 [Escherichia coli]|nr:hypothetical protein [Escherichia coli]EKB6404209.1 hypothetical protein [Shigella sonnei]DAJ50533.1 MAG TPA: tail tape measure [Caudoviricetes sp.]EER6653928.1 hypothetical protein [Escherichia coli]EET3040292.1 hypothetical protein [Escherichia coli]